MPTIEVKQGSLRHAAGIRKLAGEVRNAQGILGQVHPQDHLVAVSGESVHGIASMPHAFVPEEASRAKGAKARRHVAYLHTDPSLNKGQGEMALRALLNHIESPPHGLVYITATPEMAERLKAAGYSAHSASNQGGKPVVLLSKALGELPEERGKIAAAPSPAVPAGQKPVKAPAKTFAGRTADTRTPRAGKVTVITKPPEGYARSRQSTSRAPLKVEPQYDAPEMHQARKKIIDIGNDMVHADPNEFASLLKLQTDLGDAISRRNVKRIAELLRGK